MKTKAKNTTQSEQFENIIKTGRNKGYKAYNSSLLSVLLS